MSKEPIEETIQQTEKSQRRNNFRKGLAIALTTGILGYSTGRIHESKTHQVYQTGARTEIAKLAMKGYTFKEDSDPTFYCYRTELKVDSTNKKMQGVLIKEDGTRAGPIRKEGRVGYSVPERTIKEGRRTLELIKEKGEQVIEYGRKHIDSIQEKHFQRQ